MATFFLNSSSAESCANGTTGFDCTTTQGTPGTIQSGNVSDVTFIEVLTFDVTVGAAGETGDYDISVDVNTVSGTVNIRYRLQRLASGCSVQDSSSYATGFTDTGTHAATIAFSPTWSVGDVLRLSIEISRPSGQHGNKNITVDVNDTLSFITDPGVTNIELAADVNGSAAVTTALEVQRSLAADTNGTALITADLQVETLVDLAADINASATVTADLDVSRPLSSEITGSAVVTADLAVIKSLAADVSGTASVAADLNVSRSLASGVTGSATVTAALSVTGGSGTVLTGILEIPNNIRPSYKSGYARNAGESTVPGLWKGLVYGSSPALGPTGQKLLDLSGYGNNGVLTNMDGTDFIVGSEGYALDYNSSYVEFTPPESGLSEMSISTWVLADSYTLWGSIVKSWNETYSAATRDIHLGLEASSQSVSNYIHTTTGQVGPVIDPSSLTLNTWTHYSVTCGNGTMRLFRDGDEVDSIAYTGTFQGNVLTTIGKKVQGGTNDFWDGKISDVLYHNRALTPSEIAELYRIGPGGIFQHKSRRIPYSVPEEVTPPTTAITGILEIPNNVKASYKSGYAKSADESIVPGLWKGLIVALAPSLGVTGKTLYDLSGNGNDGNLINMDADNWVVGERGYAIDYDETGNYVDVSPFSLSASIDRTISMWVNPSEDADSDFLFFSETDLFGVAVRDTGAIDTIAFYDGSWHETGVKATLNEFQLLSFTFEGTTAKVYKNATQIGGDITYSQRSIGGDVLLGANPNSPSGPNQFTGQISDTLIYNRVLAPNEVSELYRIGPGGIFQRKSIAFPFVEEAVAPTTGTAAVISVPWKVKPSFKSGYAKSKDESASPQLRDGLVNAWVACLGVTGNKLLDVSGYGDHGDLTNMDPASDWVVGTQGYALDFDGTNDYINLTSSFKALKDSPFSVSARLKLDSYANAFPEFLSLQTDTVRALEFAFSQTASYDGILFGSGLTWARFHTSGGSSLPGSERHVMVTYNGKGASTMSNYKIYLEGVSQSLNAAGIFGGNSNSTKIGAQSNLGSAQFWDGQISEILIYNRELNSNEAAELTRLGPGGIFKKKALQVPFFLEGDVVTTDSPWYQYYYNSMSGY